MISSPNDASAATAVNIIALTNDGIDQDSTDIYGDKIVWQDAIDGIYVYDMVSLQNTVLMSGAGDPSIFGNKVSYFKGVNVYVYDLSIDSDTDGTPNYLETERPAPDLAETQLTNDAIMKWSLDMSENAVVWKYENGGGGQGIAYYNIQEETEHIVAHDNRYNDSPAAYGDYIVWWDGRGANAQIYKYKISTGQESIVSPSSNDQTQPDIYDNKIVWYENRGGQASIYLYNIDTATETRPIGDVYWPQNPTLYESKLVYEQCATGSCGIYMRDIATNEDVYIENYKKYDPHIFGDKIVYNDYSTGSGEVIYASFVEDNTPPTFINLSGENRPINVDDDEKISDFNPEFSVRPADENGISHVTFQLDSMLEQDSLVPDENGVFTFSETPWICYNEGGHTIKFWAYDNLGNVAHIYRTFEFESTACNESFPIKRITNNLTEERLPTIYGNKVFWQDDRTGSQKVYSSDLVTSAEANISDSPTRSHSEPSSNQNRVVWSDEDENWNSYIYLKEGTEQGYPISKPAIEKYQYNPTIYGNYIVYEEYDPVEWNEDVYLYNISTGQTIRLSTPTDEGGDSRNPVISSEYVVWEKRDTSGWRLYKYNISTGITTKLTTSDNTQRNAAIYKDKVVWQEDRDGNYDIYLYDLLKSKETRITNYVSDQTYPSIYGDYILWTDNRDGSTDIFAYSIINNKESRITVDSAWDNYPSIYKNNIVWLSNRDGQVDIYSAKMTDIFGPSIFGIEKEVISGSESRVAWSTDEPAYSQVEYGTTASYDQKTLISNSLRTTETVTIDKLKPDTLYHFRIKTIDQSGNTSFSSDSVFVTLYKGEILLATKTTNSEDTHYLVVQEGTGSFNVDPEELSDISDSQKNTTIFEEGNDSWLARAINYVSRPILAGLILIKGAMSDLLNNTPVLAACIFASLLLSLLGLLYLVYRIKKALEKTKKQKS